MRALLGALLSSAALGAPIVGSQRGELAPTPLDAPANSTRPLRFAGIHASDVGAVACMGDSEMLGAFLNLKRFFPDFLQRDFQQLCKSRVLLGQAAGGARRAAGGHSR